MNRCSRRTRAWRVHRIGGAGEAMSWDEIELRDPGEGEVRLRHTAIGVNRSDIRTRNAGVFLQERLTLPAVPGMEGVGVVQALGEGVRNIRPGDRVAYVGMGGGWNSSGSYCLERNVPAARLVIVPDDIADAAVAAVFSKGLTAACLLRHVFPVKRGDTVLIHAAAGGTGLILSQWARHLGAQVIIGTVGSSEKARIAREHGCTHTILYKDCDFVGAVRSVVPEGVNVVYDGVGKDTFAGSLECLRAFGTLVCYGTVSGAPPLLDPRDLLAKGSLSVACPGLRHFLDTREMLTNASSEIFDLIREEGIAACIGASYAIESAVQAHRDIESGVIAGAAILLT